MGCEEKINEGSIINLVNEPESTYFYMMPIIHTVNDITFITYIPIFMNDDEDFKVTFQQYDVNTDEVSERTVYVSEERFRNLSLNDYFCVDEGCADNDKDERGRNATPEEVKLYADKEDLEKLEKQE